MSKSNAAAAKGADELAGVVAFIESASDAELQKILEAAIRAYGQRPEDSDLPIFAPGNDVTATDVTRAATAMLQAVGLQLFELGMWQAWSGKH